MSEIEKMDPKEKYKRIKSLRREMREEGKLFSDSTILFYLMALCVIALAIVVLSGSRLS